ncbi:predicted protein [Micromonas commoda]|uniref:Uncharacterized protein n=1 Tax=Micromonas commoda (strain RCC299 / NOUM17 / CCMP2709) TaxID=296587 RepID=C1E9P2_MICCC|nr:predicted protein [Micromonas commoda]ACO64713.1 predicted protein [Micromonas commoda]|eukprot:XP_002503455.1 predicted protein [Micromonas commoda]
MTATWWPNLEDILELRVADPLLTLPGEDDGEERATKRKRGASDGRCEHGSRWRSKCKTCSACPHGRHRYLCVECGGIAVCEHDRERESCAECGGSGICTHGRRRSTCVDCGGKGICAHGRHRSRCQECRAGVAA